MKNFLLMGLTLALALFSTAVFAADPLANMGPADFKLQSRITEIEATVESVDYQGRKITLRGPEGNLFTTSVDDDVENFNKVKKGDKVDIELYDSLALTLQKNNPKKEVMQTTTQTTWNAITKHKKPIKVEAKKIEQTANITAVNMAKGTVTLVGVQGMPIEVKVQDPKNLVGVQKGDQLDITYIESVAVEVRRK